MTLYVNVTAYIASENRDVYTTYPPSPLHPPLPVRLSVPHGLVTRKEKKQKIKNGINVLQGASQWSGVTQSKVKVTERQKPQEITAYLAYMFTYGRRLKFQLLRRRLRTRPNPLLDLVSRRRLRQLDVRPRIVSPTSFLVIAAAYRSRLI